MDRSKSLFVYGLCLVGPALAAGRPDGKDGEPANLKSSPRVATPVPMVAVSTQAAFSAIASLIPVSAMKSVASAPATVSSLAAPSVSAVKSEASSVVAKATSMASAAKSEASMAKSEASSAVASAKESALSAIVPAKETVASVIAHSAVSSASSAISAVSSAIAVSAASKASIEAPKVTPKPSTTAKSTPYIDDWRTRQTWPVGCEEWANPCPQGVPLEGGGTARTLSNNYVPVGSQSGYTNGFTSYLTMTDANGVVTGMPPVATLPAGLSKLPDWVTKTSPAPKPAAPSTMTLQGNPAPPKNTKQPSPTDAAHATTSAGLISTTNDAGSVTRTVGIPFVVGLIGLVAVLL